MSRWVPVSLMLLAQVIALATPVCFVRCEGPDGHACVQLAGSDCHCCEFATDDEDAHELSASCCDKHPQHGSRDHGLAAVVGVCGDCGCQHSLLETAPAVAAKSFSQTMQTQGVADFAVMLFASSIPAARDVLLDVGLRESLLRPQVSAKLSALATVVLRV